MRRKPTQKSGSGPVPPMLHGIRAIHGNHHAAISADNAEPTGGRPDVARIPRITRTSFRGARR